MKWGHEYPPWLLVLFSLIVGAFLFGVGLWLASAASAQSVMVCRDDLGSITTFANPRKNRAGHSWYHGWYPTPGASVHFGACRDRELCEFLSSLQTGCFERSFKTNDEMMDYLTGNEK